MNRLQVAILIFVLCITTIQAQTSNATIDALLDPLTEDLNALTGSICEDTAPELLQLALAGDIAGAAAYDGDFPHGTVIVPAIGVTFGNGLATVLNSGAHDWKFITPLPTLIESAVNGSQAADLYSASRKVFPYPSLAGGLGFGIKNDIEFLCSGTFIPQSLTDFLVQTANNSALTSLAPQFSTGSVVLKVRKVFFRDSNNWPAMSLSLGCAYGATTLGANINLEDLLGSAISLGDTVGTVNLSGPLNFDAKMYGIGMDFAISKQFFIFVPFARTGIWYHHSTVTSKIAFAATVTGTDGSILTQKPIELTSTNTSDAIAGRIAVGMEFRFKPVVFHLSADLNLENPLVNLASTGIAIEGLTLKTGFRVAF